MLGDVIPTSLNLILEPYFHGHFLSPSQYSILRVFATILFVLVIGLPYSPLGTVVAPL